MEGAAAPAAAAIVLAAADAYYELLKQAASVDSGLRSSFGGDELDLKPPHDVFGE